MITAITIENFKGIRERIRLELKPITLLFGPNSAGKSTIIQALHYAREVRGARNLDAVTTASGGTFVDLGGFDNFVHNHDTHLQVTIRLDASLRNGEELYDPRVPSPDSEELDERIDQLALSVRSTWVEFSVAWDELANRLYVESYSVGINGNRVGSIRCDAFQQQLEVVELNLEHPIFKVDARNTGVQPPSLLEDIWTARQSGSERPPTSYDLRWVGDALPFWDRPLPLAQDFGPQMERLLSFLIVGPGMHLRDKLEFHFSYLGPLREVPSRQYSIQSIGPGDDRSRWPGGLGAWDVIASEGSSFNLDRANT